jgi:hypothetical protein
MARIQLIQGIDRDVVEQYLLQLLEDLGRDLRRFQYDMCEQQIQGEAYLVRFVDDFVVSFQYQADAEEFQRQLREGLYLEVISPYFDAGPESKPLSELTAAFRPKEISLRASWNNGFRRSAYGFELALTGLHRSGGLRYPKGRARGRWS